LPIYKTESRTRRAKRHLVQPRRISGLELRKAGIPDTSVFIFELEQNRKYIELVHSIFRWLEEPASYAATSTVTMLESPVHPYRRSDVDTVNRFYALLSSYPNLHWVELTLPVADAAARLRAEFGLKTPDAIHAASSLAARATGFISNDPASRRVVNLDVLILDELIKR
jgi:predicted nucleic acid-binding protein